MSGDKIICKKTLHCFAYFINLLVKYQSYMSRDPCALHGVIQNVYILSVNIQLYTLMRSTHHHEAFMTARRSQNPQSIS